MIRLARTCALLWWAGQLALVAAEQKSVVMIAGRPSHGPGEHEYNAGTLLLAKCLREGAGQLVEVKVHLNSEWPSADELAHADTIVLYTDGFTGNLALQAGNLAELAAQMKRGCGLLALHWSLEVPKEKGGAEFLEWLGGYCEPYWSVTVPRWTAQFAPPAHPITQGVQPFTLHDEWYFHMRFQDGRQGVTPILSTVPPLKTNLPDGLRSGNADARKQVLEQLPQHIAWATERADGGRGFGFTGGHTHKNWGNDDQRKLVLNAILWTAKAAIPPLGVQSKVTAEELLAHLDPKGKK